MTLPGVNSEFLCAHTQLLLSSYCRWTGASLLPSSDSGLDDAEVLFHAPFVLVSATPGEDPVLNYGNAAALRLWECSWEELTSLPARKTAEPVHREERAEFLRRVRESGFIDDYSGVRISFRGNRFRIKRATVWNLVDPQGLFCGQAATFSEWEPL
jgi:hypothetical protein